MLRQWQSTVPLSIEINWNLKLKIATWPYNAIHSPTRTSRTGSWSSNQTNPVTLETRSVQRSKLSHGRGDLDWQPNETFYLWSTCIFCSHMRETRKSSAMPTCQCWVDSFILLLQYWYWNYLELFGRDMILWYNSMILHDEIYWIHVEMVGHGTFACLESRKVCIQAKIKLVFNAICKGYTSFNSKRCQNLPNLMPFLCGIHVHPTMQRA